MPSIINATTTNGVAVSGDNSGALALQTNNGTTAVTISTGQNATFAQTINAPNTFGFKNRIINGAMVIDQRGSASSPVNSGSDTYFVDRWCMFATAGAIFNGRQSTVAPAGFTNSALFTSTAASTPAAGNATGFRQKIEGFNVADLGWGTANAQTVTLSFWVRSSITGTYSISLFNADSSGPNRSYVATYTVNSANTFEYKTITITGETTGTWNTTNGQGIQVWWDLGSGSNLNGTAGVWNSSLATRTSGSTNWSGTNGATFYITGVQLEVGTTATSFDYRPYGTEFNLCARYYYRSTQYSTYSPVGVGRAWSTTTGNAPFFLPVPMRGNQTISFSNLSDFDIVTIGNPTSIGNDGSGPNNVKIGWGKTTGVTSGTLYQFEFGNTTSGWLGFSAEL